METTIQSLLQLAPLDRMPRLGWIQAGVPESESIAAHSWGVALIALALGPRVDPPLDSDRAASLAVLHDTPEALLGDLSLTGTGLIGRGAKAAAEERGAEQLLAPLGGLAFDRWQEQHSAESREGRFVRLCDRLHLGLTLLRYRLAGQTGLGEFQTTLEELDCTEFPPCDELKRCLLAKLRSCHAPA